MAVNLRRGKSMHHIFSPDNIINILLFIFPVLYSIAFVNADKKFTGKGKLMIAGALILFGVTILIPYAIKPKVIDEDIYLVSIIVMFDNGIDKIV